MYTKSLLRKIVSGRLSKAPSTNDTKRPWLRRPWGQALHLPWAQATSQSFCVSRWGPPGSFTRWTCRSCPGLCPASRTASGTRAHTACSAVTRLFTCLLQTETGTLGHDGRVYLTFSYRHNIHVFKMKKKKTKNKDQKPNQVTFPQVAHLKASCLSACRCRPGGDIWDCR